MMIDTTELKLHVKQRKTAQFFTLESNSLNADKNMHIPMHREGNPVLQ